MWYYNGNVMHLFVYVCLCVCVCVCLCLPFMFVFCMFVFKDFELCDGMLSYVVSCGGGMHSADVRVLRCSCIKFHSCECGSGV